MPKTVLITTTSWWPTSAQLAISLASAGLQVDALYPRKGHPLAVTSAVTSRFVYNALSPLQALQNAIRLSSPELLVPCDDRATAHLHRLHAMALAAGSSSQAIARLIERSLGDPASFAVLRSRSSLLELAAASGIRVPRTMPLNTGADLDHWDRVQVLPWFIKSDGSWGGLGVKAVNTREEAKAVMAAMHRPVGLAAMLKRLVVNRDGFWIEPWRIGQAPALSVHAAVQGRPANCIVFARCGEILGATAVEVVSAQSRTGPATVVRVVDGSEMLGIARTLVHKLQLSGYLGFDFLIDESSGLPYLIELNPRFAMPGHLRLPGAGDLSATVARELTGKDAAPPACRIQNETIAYFPQAWLADPAASVLRSAYHDVPWSEPGLVRELMLLSWPDRSFLARSVDKLRGSSATDRRSWRVDFLPPTGGTLPQDHG